MSSPDDNLSRLERAYMVGAVTVWVGIIVTVGLLLAVTPYLPRVLPILGGGAFFFVVLIPGAFSRLR